MTECVTLPSQAATTLRNYLPYRTLDVGGSRVLGGLQYLFLVYFYSFGEVYAIRTTVDFSTLLTTPDNLDNNIHT